MFLKTSDNIEPKNNKKKWLIAAGSILAAGAAIAGIVLTRGKKAPSSLNGMTDDVASRINEVLTKAKKTDVYYNTEPVVTRLKNGGFKYEFEHINKESASLQNAVYIFDKNGNFDKLIQFTKFRKKIGDKPELVNYSVYNKPEMCPDALVKSMKKEFLPQEPFRTKGYILKIKSKGAAPTGITVLANDNG